MPEPTKKSEMVEVPQAWIERLKTYRNNVTASEDRVRESFAIGRLMGYLESLDSLIDD